MLRIASKSDYLVYIQIGFVYLKKLPISNLVAVTVMLQPIQLIKYSSILSHTGRMLVTAANTLHFKLLFPLVYH